MAVKRLLILPFIVLFLFLVKDVRALLAPNAASTWVTRIGNPSSTAPVVASDCPIPQGRIFGGSYGPPTNLGGFEGIFAPDSSGIGGHCSPNYNSYVPGLCSPLEENGNLVRTAKSIDVVGPGMSSPGDPVYLPTIRGQEMTWFYKGTVSAGGSFGYMKIFQSDNTADGVYTIHFVHVYADNPSLDTTQPYHSGDLVASLYPQPPVTHLHVTVGLNVGDWEANNLEAFSPGWLSADRDLGMCGNPQ